MSEPKYDQGGYLPLPDPGELIIRLHPGEKILDRNGNVVAVVDRHGRLVPVWLVPWWRRCWAWLKSWMWWR